MAVVLVILAISYEYSTTVNKRQGRSLLSSCITHDSTEP